MSFMDGLLNNNTFMAGANILANNRNSNLQSFGAGMVGAGQQNSQRKLLETKQRQQEALDRYRQLQMQQMEAQMNAPPERQISEVDGVPYYRDTGEPVIPNAQRKPSSNLGKLKQEQAVYAPGSPEWQYYEQAIQKEATNLPTGMTMGPDGKPQYMPEYLQGQQQIRSAGQPQTNVNVNAAQGPRYDVGSIRQDYRQVYDEQGRPTHQELMPGTQGAAERDMRTQSGARVAGNVLRDAKYINGLIDDMHSSPILRSARAKIPGTPEYEMDREIQAMQASIAIDQLINLKQQGGTMGQVPQEQLMTLAQLMGDLDITRDPNRLRDLMGDIQVNYLEILARMTPEERASVNIAEREFNELINAWSNTAPTRQDGSARMSNPDHWQPTGNPLHDAETYLNQGGQNGNR